MGNRKPKGFLGTSVTKESKLNKDRFKKIMCRVQGSCATCRKQCNIGTYINFYPELLLMTHTSCKNPMEGA